MNDITLKVGKLNGTNSTFHSLSGLNALTCKASKINFFHKTFKSDSNNITFGKQDSKPKKKMIKKSDLKHLKVNLLNNGFREGLSPRL